MQNSRTVLDVGSQLNDFPFENESAKNIGLNYLNETKERKSDEPRDKQPSDVVISKENADPVGTGETVSEYEDTGGHNNQLRKLKLSEGMSEIEIWRSDRLKDRPQRTYTDDSYLYSCVINADTCVSATPNSFEEIKTRSDRSHWEKEELDSHFHNNTWSLVQRSENKNIVDCKWVFTLKHDESGNPVRYKARLVARGFTQEYLIDYDETFAPVARISSLRLMLSFSNQFSLKVHHMDVKTALLNGILKEEIYMVVPQGVSCESGKVCKLNKAIYGLKQAARCWFEVFEQSLKEIGFVNSAVDRCIYILNNNNILKNIYVLLYVDDLVIAAANDETIINFKAYLMKKFKMTDLLEIRHFIGIKIERKHNQLELGQSAYIRNVLKKFKMEDCM